MRRSQLRILRLGKENFSRVLPNAENGTVKESFPYRDVMKLSLTAPHSGLIEFYSEKAPEKIYSERIDEIFRILIEKGKSYGNDVKLIKEYTE